MDKPDEAVEDARLEQIQARADKATQGPWDVDAGDSTIYSLSDVFHGPMFIFKPHEDHVDGWGEPSEDCTDDAVFIANAREDVPYLLALVREQAVQLEGLRTDMQNAMADAWDDGFFDGKRHSNEGDDGPRFINPYHAALTATEGAK